jgi:hypothetical protein
MVSVIVFLIAMTQNLPKKFLGLASFVFIVVFWGAVFAQRWLDNVYWLPLAALSVVAILCLLALATTDKSKNIIQKLIERLPILASFLILLVSIGVVCLVLAIGLREGLKVSKKYFPKSGPIEGHGTSDGVTATVQHPSQPPPDVAKPLPEPVPEPVAKPSLTKPKVRVSKETTQ